MAYQEISGSISGKYESGTRGVSTISTGAGDAGGVSYGKHQLSSKTGTMSRFLSSKFGTPYKALFGNTVPGTTSFNNIYKQICKDKPKEFEVNQFLFIAETHYDPQVVKLKNNGIDVYPLNVAARECVFSVSVQYGANTSLIVNAVGANFKGTAKEFIEKVQNYRRDTVKTYFKSSSKAVQDGVAKRADNEKADLLKLLEQTQNL